MKLLVIARYSEALHWWRNKHAYLLAGLGLEVVRIDDYRHVFGFRTGTPHVWVDRENFEFEEIESIQDHLDAMKSPSLVKFIKEVRLSDLEGQLERRYR